MLTLANTPPQGTPNRMSSREVAGLTGKAHGHIMRDIREMCAALAESKIGFCCEPAKYDGDNGQQYDMYNLDRATTECLLTGYDPVSRMKVIQRWHVLEEQQQKAQVAALPQTFAQALRALAETVEQNEQLQAQVIEQQPAVEFVEQVTGSEDTMPVSEAAKLLGVGPIKLFIFLRESGIFMNGTGGQHRNIPYQQYLNAGYFELDERPFKTPDGKTHINVKPVVTQKGLKYIRERLPNSL